MGPRETSLEGAGTDAGRRRGALLVATALAVVLTAAAMLALVIHLATPPSAGITLAGRPVRVDVADTLLRQVWGLQGRSSLADGRGMLFAFETTRPVTFVRASLTFPIDVVFVDGRGSVTGVATLDAAHGTADSHGPVRWVVEVPGGWARRSGVGTGSLLETAR
jgi:uncharacterized protein